MSPSRNHLADMGSAKRSKATYNQQSLALPASPSESLNGPSMHHLVLATLPP